MTTTATKSTITNNAVYINKMFNKIATKYDLLNNLMTFGYHYNWKVESIKLALTEIVNPKNALDLCSGTGDLAIILSQLCPKINITCIDNSNNMLNIAKSKTKKLNLNNTSFLLFDFEKLSNEIAPSSIDLITIGFGLRNLIDKEHSLENIYKLLKKDGVFTCIDLGHPRNKLWEKIFLSYFFNIIPKLGQIFAYDKEAYTYLPTSLNSWYKQDELKNIILKTGFEKCYFKDILGGAVAIHVAVK
ncbi:MAG: ubiquinone/menaquinone biosynthesis methyltransferase [Candidatus Melainabacteria bacterium]|nr:ubiquinone/menaquinone biosynthesis methyltransferase [Candidatus Melainabacteria bacterium]